MQTGQTLIHIKSVKTCLNNKILFLEEVVGWIPVQGQKTNIPIVASWSNAKRGSFLHLLFQSVPPKIGDVYPHREGHFTWLSPLIQGPLFDCQEPYMTIHSHWQAESSTKRLPDLWEIISLGYVRKCHKTKPALSHMGVCGQCLRTTHLHRLQYWAVPIWDQCCVKRILAGVTQLLQQLFAHRALHKQSPCFATLKCLVLVVCWLWELFGIC